MKAKTVLITGCSDGGIGSDLSRCFATRGFKVIATARSRSKMSALETVPNVILLELNICSSNSIAAALEAVLIETGGTLDLLVNNAGVSYRSAALEVDDRMARELFDVNLWGVVDAPLRLWWSRRRVPSSMSLHWGALGYRCCGAVSFYDGLFTHRIAD